MVKRQVFPQSGSGSPISEPVFLILLSLASGEKHGYAILKDVASLSQKRLTLSTSTLYGALARLEDQGLIEHIETDGPVAPGLPRRVFRLSSDGRRMLEAETKRMHSLAAIAQQRLSENG
jgi:DNA-binding PadR family transcriptional regulator